MAEYLVTVTYETPERGEILVRTKKENALLKARAIIERFKGDWVVMLDPFFFKKLEERESAIVNRHHRIDREEAERLGAKLVIEHHEAKIRARQETQQMTRQFSIITNLEE